MTSDKEYEDLLAELRVAGLVVDPVPERVMFAAKASLSWRTIDAELAELTYDSALDDDRLSLVRGATAARMLTFSAGGLPGGGGGGGNKGGNPPLREAAPAAPGAGRGRPSGGGAA